MTLPSGNLSARLNVRKAAEEGKRHLSFHKLLFLLWFNFICSQWTEEDEIADYKKNQEWMDECMDGMFEKWYDKIDEEESMEDRRKVHCSP